MEDKTNIEKIIEQSAQSIRLGGQLEANLRIIYQIGHKAGIQDGKEEIVICAGIKLADGRVLRCHRHGDGMLNAHHNGWKLAEGVEQQGFVTSTGRYVSREEGRKLQDLAGIPSADKDGYRGTTLFSEDLY